MKFNTALTIFFVPYVIFEVCSASKASGFLWDCWLRQKLYANICRACAYVDTLKHPSQETQASCLAYVPFPLGLITGLSQRNSPF